MTTKHKSEGTFANDIARSICTEHGGTVAIIGPLVSYPGKNEDDDDIWSVAIVTNKIKNESDYNLTQIKLGTVIGEMSSTFEAAFETIIEVRGPDDLKEKEALELREQIIRALKLDFSTVHVSDDELHLVEKMEQVWPGEKSSRLRGQIETERAAQESPGND